MLKLTMEKDNKQNSVERYPWSLLLRVSSSDRSPTEFVIELLPEISSMIRTKERLALLQSGQKTNITQLVLHSTERNRLVAELRHIIHLKNNRGTAQLVETCTYQNEIDQETSLQQSVIPLNALSRFQSSVNPNKKKSQRQLKCKVSLHPSTIIILKHKSGESSRSKDGSRLNATNSIREIIPSQTGMGSLLMSEIQVKQEMSPRDFGIEDSSVGLIMVGSGYGEEDHNHSYNKSQLQSDTAFLFSKNEEKNQVNDDLKAEQELDQYHQMIAQDLDGGLFGGNNDEGKAEVQGFLGNVGNLPETLVGANYVQPTLNKFDKISFQSIYVNEIEMIITRVTTVMVVMKNQDIEQIVFNDTEVLERFVAQLTLNFQDVIKKDLPTHILHPTKKLREFIPFLNWSCKDPKCNCEKTCFKVEVMTFQSSSFLLLETFLGLDKDNIYEIEKKKFLPLRQIPIATLEFIKIIDDDPSHNLSLHFTNEMQLKVYCRTHIDRERIISCLMHLRNFCFANLKGPKTLNRLKILHNQHLDMSLKILGYSPVEDDSTGSYRSQVTEAYEFSLVKKLFDQMESENKDNMQLNNLIDEILLNATFSSLTKVPIQMIKIIMQDLVGCFRQYLDFEENHPDLIASMLSRGRLPIPDKALVKYLGEKETNKRIKCSYNQTEDFLLEKRDMNSHKKASNFKEIYDQTIRYLNILKSLLNSRIILQEIAEQEQLLRYLTKLLISKSPYISLLAAQVIKACTHHFSGNESKIERTNKKLLIRGQQLPVDQAQTIPRFNKVLELHGNQKQRSPRHFFDSVFEYLKYFEFVYDKRKIVHSIHLAGISEILGSILLERQSSSSREDVQQFVNIVNSNSQTEVHDFISQDKPFLQLLDKFSLFDSQYFDIQYMFTMMICSTLNFYFENEMFKELNQIQTYILNYSIQVIWHLYLMMESKQAQQKDMSIKLISRLLHKNKETHELLLRILPSTLFEKTKGQRQGVHSLTWNHLQWNEFFSEIVPHNFNHPLELWNSDTRRELKEKLLREKRQFIEMKRICYETIQDKHSRRLILPIHKFTPGRKVTSIQKNPKWNHGEFEIQYECLAKYHKVGKYFLVKLINFGSQNQNKRPSFTVTVTDPFQFWQDLITQFMASAELEEQKIILMTLCILYDEHCDKLKEMNTIPYWLRLLENREYSHCHFLILQLINVALSVKHYDSVKTNIQILIKSNGFLVLHNALNSCFIDICPLKPEKQTQEIERTGDFVQVMPAMEFQNSLLKNDMLEIVPISMSEYDSVEHANSERSEKTQSGKEIQVLNFTRQPQNSQYFQRNSLPINKAILALKIFDLIFNSNQFETHLPLPQYMAYMLQPFSLATLTQMLLVKNEDLTSELLTFIDRHLSSHYALYLLKNSGMIELLILDLDTCNGEKALNLLAKFQDVSIQFNESLDFGQMEKHDLKMVQEDKAYNFVNQMQIYRDKMMSQHSLLDLDQDTLLSIESGGQEKQRSFSLNRNEQLNMLTTSHYQNQLFLEQDAVLLESGEVDKENNIDLYDNEFFTLLEKGLQLPMLLESILLRYLPVPFIQFLYENKPEKFLEVFRMESYKHPILIWNNDLKRILVKQIEKNTIDIVVQLKEFALNPKTSNQPTLIPIYDKQVTKVVKYDQIESEVRCGRYYLSIWVNQNKNDLADFYKIPQHEELEFHYKLKAELDLFCASESNDRDKLVILFRACLLALKKFHLKRICCLSQIKVILSKLMDVSVQQNQNSKLDSLHHQNATVSIQQLVYIGTKIIHMAIHEDEENCQEIISMDGIQIQSEIMGYILRNNAIQYISQEEKTSFLLQTKQDEINQTNLDSGNSLQSPQRGLKTEGKSISDFRIVDQSSITRVEAKTLNLCIESIIALFRKNQSEFTKLALEQRIYILGQMGQLLDLSFSLYPMLEKRELKSFTPFQNYSSSKLKESEKRLKNQSSKKQQERNTHNMRLEEAIKESIDSQNSLQKATLLKSQELAYKAELKLGKVPSESNTSQTSLPSLALKTQKAENIDYSKHSLLEIVKLTRAISPNNKPDSYTVALIFTITKSIFSLVRTITESPLLQPEIIASGLAWRAIQHLYYDMCSNIYRKQDLFKSFLVEASETLRLLISFIDRFCRVGAQGQANFTVLTQPTQHAILTNFHECVQKLLTIKMQEHLISDFKLSTNSLFTIKFKNDTTGQTKEFFKLFSCFQLQSPELVWNDETRNEMYAKLNEQLWRMQTQVTTGGEEVAPLEVRFCDVTKEFEYSVDRTELRIQGIFVKYFNQQCKAGSQETYKMEKQEKFAEKIIQKLSELSSDPQTNENQILELVDAFKNLIMKMGLQIKNQTDFEHYFEILCNQIQLDDCFQNGSRAIQESEKVRLRNLSSLVLEIIQNIIVRHLNSRQQVNEQLALFRNFNKVNTTTSIVNAVQQKQLVQKEIERLTNLPEYKTFALHCQFLLNCNSFFQLMMRMMYQREIEIVNFRVDVIQIIRDLIKMPEEAVRLFIDKGLIMFLLNLIFDGNKVKVVDTETRCKLTDTLLKIERAMQSLKRGNMLALVDIKQHGVIKAFIPQNFFAEINEQMWRWKNNFKEELVEMQIKFLENFDADSFENALVKWDKNSREESHAKVRDLCEKIFFGQKFQDLRLLEQIINMDLEKEDRIMQVILRNFNQNPSVFINVKLNIFITEVANQLYEVSQELWNMRQGPFQDQLSEETIQKLQNMSYKMSNEQKKFKYICYKTQLQLTSLLLSIEQLLYNEYNPNLLLTKKDERMDPQARLTISLIERTTDIRQIEEKVFKYFNTWLKYPVFLDDQISEHIRITFLQVLLLIIDVPTSMNFLKQSEVPLQFITQAIDRICRESRNTNRLIEDSLILLIAQKMLRIDLQYTCPQLAMKDNLDKLVHIAVTKKQLSRHIEYIMYLILQNTHYATNIIEVLERKNRNKHDLEKLKGSERTEQFNQIWRSKPQNKDNAKKMYLFSETGQIERALYTMQLEKLPILSSQAIEKFQEEFLPTEVKDFHSGKKPNQSFNLQLLSKNYLNSSQREQRKQRLTSVQIAGSELDQTDQEIIQTFSREINRVVPTNQHSYQSDFDNLALKKQQKKVYTGTEEKEEEETKVDAYGEDQLTLQDASHLQKQRHIGYEQNSESIRLTGTQYNSFDEAHEDNNEK